MGDPKKYRLSDDHDALIREISSASGGAMKEVDVVRVALDALKDYWNHHGKRLLIPLRFNETFSITKIDPQQPMILREPPRAKSESVGAADLGRTRKRGHQSTVPA